MMQILFSNHLKQTTTYYDGKSGGLAMVLDLCAKTRSTTNKNAPIVKPFLLNHRVSSINFQTSSLECVIWWVRCHIRQLRISFYPHHFDIILRRILKHLTTLLIDDITTMENWQWHEWRWGSQSQLHPHVFIRCHTRRFGRAKQSAWANAFLHWSGLQ